MRPPQPIPVGMEPPPMRDRMPTPSACLSDQGGKAKGSARNAAAGRFAVVNAFIDATMADLTPAERSCWFVLWRDTRPGGLARTSQASMAKRAGISDRAVRAALRALERRGLLRVARRGRLGRGASAYRVYATPRGAN